jgi:hypothetical protein
VCDARVYGCSLWQKKNGNCVNAASGGSRRGIHACPHIVDFFRLHTPQRRLHNDVNGKQRKETEIEVATDGEEKSDETSLEATPPVSMSHHRPVHVLRV